MKSFPAIASRRILALVLVASPWAARADDDTLGKARRLDQAFEAAPALALYQEVEALEPTRVEILLAIARQYRHLMMDATDEKEKLRLLGLALEYGLHAVRLAPDDAEAHLSVAITYGRRSMLEGSKAKLATSRLLRSEIDKTLQLDPANDLGWHLLGRWHESYAELSGVKRTMAEMLYGKLPTSTYEDAARCYRRALELNPQRLMHDIALGRVYAATGHPVEAREYLQKGLALPSHEKDDPETKQRGREILEKLP